LPLKGISPLIFYSLPLQVYDIVNKISLAEP